MNQVNVSSEKYWKYFKFMGTKTPSHYFYLFDMLPFLINDSTHQTTTDDQHASQQFTSWSTENPVESLIRKGNISNK